MVRGDVVISVRGSVHVGRVYWPMGARGSVCVGPACPGQWELVFGACLTCVYWPMEARGSIRVWVRV